MGIEPPDDESGIGRGASAGGGGRGATCGGAVSGGAARGTGSGAVGVGASGGGRTIGFEPDGGTVVRGGSGSKLGGGGDVTIACNGGGNGANAGVGAMLVLGALDEIERPADGVVAEGEAAAAAPPAAAAASLVLVMGVECEVVIKGDELWLVDANGDDDDGDVDDDELEPELELDRSGGAKSLGDGSAARVRSASESDERDSGGSGPFQPRSCASSARRSRQKTAAAIAFSLPERMSRATRRRVKARSTPSSSHASTKQKKLALYLKSSSVGWSKIGIGV